MEIFDSRGGDSASKLSGHTDYNYKIHKKNNFQIQRSDLKFRTSLNSIKLGKKIK